MKVFSITVASFIASTTAFTPSIKSTSSRSALKASNVLEKSGTDATATKSSTPLSSQYADMLKAEENSKDRIIPGRYADTEKSIALPFLDRPKNLDGTHAGDYGFDPLGFSESQDLYTLQESEIRHGRLAMLAVIGWPLSELFAPEWMLQNGCAPSVLNGFNPLSLAATVLLFGAAGYFEFKTSLRRVDDTEIGQKHKEDMADVWKYGVAGDYNFDPLNLYSSIGDDANARKGWRDVEISHGRSAMLGITSFAMWEYLTGHPIVENSMFFHPNLLLPSLVAAYAFATSIYEVELEDSQYLKIRKTSEGEARLENIKMQLSIAKGSSGIKDEDVSRATEIVTDFGGKVFDFAKNTQEKYGNINEAYTSYIMRNIDQVEKKS